MVIDAPEANKEILVKAAQQSMSLITAYRVLTDEQAALMDAFLARPQSEQNILMAIFQGRLNR